MEDWIELNRVNWDERAAPHAASPDYAVQRFVDEPDFISDVMRFDLPRLPDPRGLAGLHLQCHIGTDTLSLHRLGARMTGLDFSSAAIAEARALADRTGARVDYVEAAVHDALDVLPHEGFDFVFTGIGALCWLPDIRDWARTVAGLLKPGGFVFLREGHPMLWAIDEERADTLAVEHPYFERPEPVVFDEGQTYVATDHVFTATRSAFWNHGLGEIVTALLSEGFRVTLLEEHDSVPWEAIPGRMELLPHGEHRLADRPWRLPHSYTLSAVRDT